MQLNHQTNPNWNRGLSMESKFKTFIDKNTNILTMFAIFNALAVYASSIEEDGFIRQWLTAAFWLLSLLLFFELIISTWKTIRQNKENSEEEKFTRSDIFKFSIFYILASNIEIFLIAYFVVLFPQFTLFVVVMSIGIAILVLYVWLLVIIQDQRKKVAKSKNWSELKSYHIRKVITLGIVILIALTLILYNYLLNLLGIAEILDKAFDK